jgi:uncharacterized protein DUF3108
MSRLIIALALSLSASLAMAIDIECQQPKEDLRYSWRLKGPLAWIAGIAFPTSGNGSLKTNSRSGNLLDTELLISGKENDGFYIYQSQIQESSARTVTSYHGYAWRDKRRSERTLFDYVKRLVRIRRENTERIEDRVKPLPQAAVRDVLTGIYFLRQNAATISSPVTSEIYSEGKMYAVVFKPLGTETITFKGTKLGTHKFEITAAPGIDKKWPGGVKVWLADDEAHTPLRIEIKRDYTALQLDLDSMKACGGAEAAR